MTQRILRNKAKCLKCGDVIESKYRWDYVSCSCGSLAVDGGRDYLKRCGSLEEGSYEDLSEYTDEPEPPKKDLDHFSLAEWGTLEAIMNSGEK